MIPFGDDYARLLAPDPAADVEDELRFHLEAKTDDLIRCGWRRCRPPEADASSVISRAVQHIGEDRRKGKDVGNASTVTLSSAIAMGRYTSP